MPLIEGVLERSPACLADHPPRQLFEPVKEGQGDSSGIKASLSTVVEKAQALNQQGLSYSETKGKLLFEVIAQAEKGLQKTLKGWKSAGKQGMGINRLQQIDKLRRDLEAGGQDWLKTWVPDALKAGRTAGVSILQAGGIAEPLLPVIDRQVLANLLLYDYSLLKDWSDQAAGIVRRALLQAELEGVGTRGAAERLLALGIGETGVWRGTYSGAKRIARTELMRARNTAADLSYAENGIERLQWWAALDKRTGPDSIRRHKKILTRAEWQSHNFGDGYYGQPPLRPHDRCVMIPLVPGLEDDLEDNHET